MAELVNSLAGHTNTPFYLPEEKTGANTRQRLLLPESSTAHNKEIIVLNDFKPGTTRFENSPIPYMTKIINKLKLTRPKKNDNYIKL